MIVRETEVIGIGAYVLEVVTEDERCAMELAFLEAIDRRPGDDDVRSVYADWLEEQGRSNAADYLRAQLRMKHMTPEQPEFRELARTIESLGGTMSRRWRRTVARLPIEKCDLRFELVCPQRWDALARTASPNERFCGACEKRVS